ncbi:hypothetical protein M1Q06_04520 [Planococcus sp. 11815]|uniref:hypothetical protein n=1 Tax=Planococcus sp. 11815 TaxID=2939413 RepID=UPI003DA31A61
MVNTIERIIEINKLPIQEMRIKKTAFLSDRHQEEDGGSMTSKLDELVMLLGSLPEKSAGLTFQTGGGRGVLLAKQNAKNAIALSNFVLISWFL